MSRHLRLALCLLVIAVVPTRAAVLFSTNATWAYFKGMAEASSPDTTAWRKTSFVEAGWSTGPGPLYYGESYPGGTLINDMLNSYSSVFMRRKFTIADLSQVGGLKLGARCDDGFIAWINGVEVARYNMPAGERLYNQFASGSVPEPIPFNVFDITDTSFLVTGENVVAVHAFNHSLASSDLVIDLSLTSTAPDFVAPAVAGMAPVAGTVNSLSQITVTFTEPVAGVDASDLLINGNPAASMTGGNDTYVFSFPRPAYGTVQISWAGTHGIIDLALPGNAFNQTGPGARWQYMLIDNTPPTLIATLPYPGVTVRGLTQIEVLFSEAVAGVQAADLLINGSGAAQVTAGQPGQYTFQFTQPATGTVQVAWASGHGIRDLAAAPNPFAGGTWSYVLDPNAPLPNVRINEFVAANVGGLRDEDGEYQDWVELYNASSNAINLAGWALTDDQNAPARWVFPAITLGPKGYLVVFLSGKDRRPTAVGAKLHANFKLTPDGEYLALYNTETPRQPVSEFAPFPNQRNDYSYGYDSGDQLRYFKIPTPGAANGSSTITGVVADTKFSHDRGFYDAPFSLSVTSATPSAVIRYTLNGLAPTETTGSIYTTPLQITNTTVFRAAAFKPGFLGSDVDSQTYIFLNDVIRQSSNGQPPAGWPSSWGANVVDYGMDPDVVNNATYSSTIKSDLKSLPSFSIVMDLKDLFDPATGIYANPGQDGLAWEKPASIELIYPDDSQGFQIDAGIRIRGGYSRSTDNPKHAFRFFLRQEYGRAKLDYPLFGATGARSFDKFDLRTFQNYSWSFGGDSRGVFLRDQFSRDAQLAMGRAATHGEFYHLYINGQYWGLYNTEERPEASFGESYFGGREEDYDVIKVDPDIGYNIEATDGNMDAWTRLYNLSVTGFATDTAYQRVQGNNPDGTPNLAYEKLLDVPNLIDYMLIILYGGNLDAPISNFLGNTSPNNWYGMRNRTSRDGFRFFVHDSEHTLLNVNEDRTGPYPAGNPSTGGLAKSNPQYIWQQLQANAEFRVLVGDHVHRHFFNGGVLTTQGAKSLFLARSNQINRAVVGESARWGDAKTSPPLTRNGTWIPAINTVVNSFLASRSAVVLNQMKADSLYPAVAAPTFNQYQGLVAPGFNLFMTNVHGSGTIYYTVDGSDPRLAGGNISARSLAYAGPVALTLHTIVRARTRSGTAWSALVQADLQTRQDFSRLILSEVMYHPPARGAINGDEYEFLELKNAGRSTLDLTGVSFDKGVGFNFTNDTRLAPGAIFLLGRNGAELRNKYPGLIVNGLYTGKLDDNGEDLVLVHALGGTVLSFSYKDQAPWPVTTDGHGFSLVPVDPNSTSDQNAALSWRGSTAPGGSPGTDDPEPLIPAVLVNEALTHTDPPLLDAIELFNPTAASVDISGWFLTDDAAVPKKYRIPGGRSIPAGEFVVFTEADFNPTPGANQSFTLSSEGEQVYLFSADSKTNLTGYSHGFRFGAAANGVSFGRQVTSVGEEHFVAQIANTLGGPNAGPRVGPVVIKEIMYHPPDLPGNVDNQNEEFIELRNITLQPVLLYDAAAATNTWRLRDGVEFDFPTNVVLEAGQSALLLSFNPTNSPVLTAFRNKYGTFGNARFFGPYAGKLDNSHDNVELYRPDSPNPDSVPYILVDKVDYRDSAPWPVSADGGGAALHRADIFAYGNDPANWRSAAPLVILSQPSNVSAIPGSTIPMSVSAVGTGELTYQWRANGVELLDATNPTLLIPNAQLSQFGGAYSVGFTVVVSDLVGSLISAPGIFTFLVPPTIIDQPQSQTVVQGEPAQLRVLATGTPTLHYSWRRNGAILSGQTGAVLNFSSAHPTNSGNYYVLLSNPVSSSVLSFEVALTVLADTDGDRMPDTWEISHGLDPNQAGDAALDTDGDGMSNEQEYIAGTDPRDASSSLKLESFSLLSEAAHTLVMRFEAVSNKTYSVQYKDHPLSVTWTELMSFEPASGNRMLSVTNQIPAEVSPRIYRLRTPRLP